MVYINFMMFFNEKTDYESDSDTNSYSENYSPSEGEQDYVILDKSDAEYDNDNLMKDDGNDKLICHMQPAERIFHKYNASFESEVNEIIDNLKKNTKIQVIVAHYLSMMKRKDFNELGKRKIVDCIRSDRCSGIPCRMLEQIFPLSRSSINNYRNVDDPEDSFDKNISDLKRKVGRPAKLSPEQESELLQEATKEREQFHPISLIWGIDFIYKQFSIVCPTNFDTISKVQVKRVGTS